MVPSTPGDPDNGIGPGAPADRVAKGGDDIENDVLAAQAVGITSVLVRTGRFCEGKLAGASGRPQHVIGSIADLPAVLGC